jgi:hypothetical protein
MATLDQWRRFINTPTTLFFPRLQLIGRDHAPPIVIGSGEVRMLSPNHFSFTLVGVPTDVGYALKELRLQQENPYDGLARPRLEGIDSDGINWAGGYTIPRLDVSGDAWRFEGEINSLVTTDRGATVSARPSTELIFLIAPDHPMALAMSRFTADDQFHNESRREHATEILGASITFIYDSSNDIVSITATQSADLPLTYTENWLGEPLRIMFGQLGGCPGRC